MNLEPEIPAVDPTEPAMPIALHDARGTWLGLPAVLLLAAHVQVPISDSTAEAVRRLDRAAALIETYNVWIARRAASGVSCSPHMAARHALALLGHPDPDHLSDGVLEAAVAELDKLLP